MSAWDGWVADVLGGIGAPVNAQNASFVNAWHQCEGAAASFNPLNTTQPEPGATNYNSVGVKNYPDQATGLRATVTTLENGHYDGIVSDLRSGRYTAGQIVRRNESEISTWGTRPSCIASQVGTVLASNTEPPGITGSKSAPGTPNPRRVVNAPKGPAGPLPGEKISHLPQAWHEFASALATTIPTRAKLANQASRDYTRAVR